MNTELVTTEPYAELDEPIQILACGIQRVAETIKRIFEQLPDDQAGADGVLGMDGKNAVQSAFDHRVQWRFDRHYHNTTAHRRIRECRTGPRAQWHRARDTA